MRVLSLNISPGREVVHDGKPVRTGIFKRPIAGPLAVGAEGCAGDEQSDRVHHGGEHKAVYGFAGEHYPHWQALLGRELSPGAFGENLTVDGLHEAQVHIGDRLRLGSALLEVSQPRNPCFKLGIALADDRAPALFTQHFHTGVYFRVIEAGDISVGDEIHLEHSHPAAVSVYALFRAHYDRHFPLREQVLAAAAGIAELAPEWQARVEQYRLSR